MTKKEKLNLKIKKLNLAWRLIRRAIRIIKDIFYKDSFINHYIWKLSKVNDKLQSLIYKKIEQDHVDEEFKKMVKRLNKGDKNE